MAGTVLKEPYFLWNKWRKRRKMYTKHGERLPHAFLFGNIYGTGFPDDSHLNLSGIRHIRLNLLGES